MTLNEIITFVNDEERRHFRLHCQLLFGESWKAEWQQRLVKK